MQQAFEVVVPGHLDRGARADDADRVLIDLMNFLHQSDLILRNPKMCSVKSFGLGLLVQPEENQHDIRVFRKRNRFLRHVDVFGAVALIASCHPRDLQIVISDHFLDGLHMRRVDHGRPGALISGLKSEITDHRDSCAAGKRKNLVFIFQKDNALLRGAPCELVIALVQRLLIERRPFLFIKFICVFRKPDHNVQQLINAIVDVTLRNLSGFHSGEKLPRGIKARIGHFQIRAVLNA